MSHQAQSNRRLATLAGTCSARSCLALPARVRCGAGSGWRGRLQGLVVVALVVRAAAAHAQTAAAPLLTVLQVARVAAPAAAAAKPLLAFYGNLALPNEVYAAIANLPAGAVADSVTAKEVQTRLKDFLLRAGYELARVQVAVHGKTLHVWIDEGVLGRIILRGQGSLRTVEARLALDLPGRVFNRPYLNRQIARLRQDFGIDVERYELVANPDVEHVGPQIGDLGRVGAAVGAILGGSLVPPDGRKNLQIFFRQNPWPKGFNGGAGLSSADGLMLELGYRGAGLLHPGDLWLVRGVVGGRVRSRLSNGAAYPALTHADVEASWRGPRLAWRIRPNVDVTSRLGSRQRGDLYLENFYHNQFTLLAGLRSEWRSASELSLGLGVQHLDVFSLESSGTGTVEPTVVPFSLTRPVLGGQWRLVLDPDEIRRDRRHQFNFEARYFPAWKVGRYTLGGWDYRKVFSVGWHDLWVTSLAKYMFGAVPWVDETLVGGGFVRGVFADRFASRKAVNLGLEGRFSLIRDLYKLALFHDAALFETTRTGPTGANWRVINSFGLGLCMLVADAFQLDLYYAIGFAASDDFDHGLAINLKQAY